MKRSFQVLWPYMVKYRGGLVLGLGALVLKDLFAAAQPLVIGAAIDSLTREFALEKVLRFAALLAALSAIKGVFQYWMRVIIIGISRDVEFDLRNDLFARLVSLSWDFYGRIQNGRHHGAQYERSERRSHDARSWRHVLDRDDADLVLAIGVMAWVDWPLAVALLPGSDRQLCRRGFRADDPRAIRAHPECSPISAAGFKRTSRVCA